MVVSKDLRSSLFSVKQLSERIKTEDISPPDLVEVCLDRIKKLNSTINAFITIIDEKELYKQAEIAKKEIKQGNYKGTLHGIPFSIKDIIKAKGIRCTAGSKILSDYISDRDATVVKKMKEAGAILIGTNNLNEFASGITGTNPFYGSSKNPWNISKISGGSSGGSSVAVATGMVPISLGTDTGGSIRVPSSLCGVVGLKPTYGRVSKYGVLPLAPSFDHVGCITRSAWDTAAVLECISGSDILDESSVNKRIPAYTEIIELFRDKEISVGVPKSYFFDYLHSDVRGIFHNFLKMKLSNTNTVIDDNINLHNTEKYHRSWKDIRLAEASKIHVKWLQTRAKDYSKEVREMLVEGTKISATEYLDAANITKEIRNDFLSILKEKVDVIIVPTTIIPAPQIDEETINIDGEVLLRTREALLRNTIIFNSTGLPAVSIPIGLTKDNMPVGVQIIGAPFKEHLILSLAYNCECINNKDMDKFIPPLCC